MAWKPVRLLLVLLAIPVLQPALARGDVTITEGPALVSAVADATFQFSSSVPDATFKCALDGPLFNTCVSPATYLALADGPHVFQVRSVDSLGNADPVPTSYTWSIDTRPPAVSLTATPSLLSNTASVSFAFTVDDPAATLQCRLDGVWGACDTTSSQHYAGLADGEHTFTVRATDGAGNLADAAYAWTQDTVRPQTRLLSGPPTSAPVNSSQAEFSFSSTDGVRFECALNDGAWEPCVSPKAYTGLTSGTYVFEVRAIDAAGNADGTPAERTWTVELNAAPAARISVSLDGDGFLLDAGASIDPEGGTLEYRWLHDGASAGSGRTLRFARPVSGRRDSLRLTVVDPLGEQDSATISFTTTQRRESALYETVAVVPFVRGTRLAPGARARIATLRPVVAGAEELEVEGHARPSGTALAARQLSAKRAARVRDLLLADSATGPEAMRVEDLGAAAPVATNRTAAGRIRNDRVVVTVRYRRLARYLVTEQDEDPSMKLSDRPELATTSASGPVPKLFAFFSRVPGALTRLEEVGGRVSVLAPNWYALDARSGAIEGGVPDRRVMALSRRLRFAVWPVVNATIGDSPLIASATGRAKVVAGIAALASRHRLAGVTLDMEEIPPSDRARFTAVVTSLARTLHRRGRRLAVYAVRRTRTQVRTSAAAYDWAKLAAAADLLLASGYNEHGPGTAPGPVTTLRGFRDLTDYATGISRQRVAPTMGAFGYRWQVGARPPELITSADAELRWPAPAEAGSADGRHVTRGGDRIYYESAEDLWARERAARNARSRWIGLFSLGREPASFWERSAIGRSAR